MRKILPFLILLALFPEVSPAQRATVRETTMVFPTYGFDDPNPVARMSNIYPYYRFEGYRLTPTDKAWKVIVLENRFIRVLVAPEMGGKILGAFEKKHGKDFIYFNRVVKFREIAMRGPWTSGGIEFNFGAIGHAPTTATPVDYAIDDSGPDARCTVGAWDLASRTYWTVEIVVPPNAALVETRSTWTNPTELNTSLYHWMNAAADASDDLVFEYPGTAYIGHDGTVSDFPASEDGIRIDYYRNNAQGSNKSFHVLGVFTNFFGARYENSRTGVIHWAPYTDKPGKKIWQWSQAREGAIWTDLLTDPDRGNPQYVEIQNGLLFNQALAASTQSPYKHRSFPPHDVISFNEAWFPFNGIGHVVDANTTGVLSVEEADDSKEQSAKSEAGTTKRRVGICAVSAIRETMVVKVDGKEVARQKVSLQPMEAVEFTVDIRSASAIEVTVGDKVLYYSTADAEARKLSRPKLPNIEFDWHSAFGLATIAGEHARQRRYEEAGAAYEQSLAIEPSFTPSLVGLAELAYRRFEYEKAIGYASQALANDTYDPAANFVYAIASRKLGRLYDAMDALGIAASHPSHATGATVQLAEIAFIRGRRDELRRALIRVDELGPKYATTARDLRMLSGEVRPERVSPSGPLDQSWFGIRYALNPTEANKRALQRSIRSELPHEAYLELASSLYERGQYNLALTVLGASPDHPMVSFWRAWLTSLRGDQTGGAELLKKGIAMPIDLVFPHRGEDLPMLLWADQVQPHWKNKYYLALLFRSVGRTAESDQLLRECGLQPDAAVFYLARASFFMSSDRSIAEQDLRKAMSLDPRQWRAPRLLGQLYAQIGTYSGARAVLAAARDRFPDNYILRFEHARSLVQTGRPAEAVSELATTTLLPFEGARVGRQVWNQANILAALGEIRERRYADALGFISRAREWPERLGVGKPDEVDERIEDYLTAVCLDRSGKTDEARTIFEHVASHAFTSDAKELLSLLALKETRNTKEGDQRAEKLVRASDTEAGYWARSVYEGRHDVQGAYEKEFQRRRAAGMWEMVEEDAGFVLVYEAMKVLE